MITLTELRTILSLLKAVLRNAWCTKNPSDWAIIFNNCKLAPSVIIV
jgi:hypothetical protein